MSDQNELVLFQTVDEQVKLNVAIEGETVWLNQQQMVELFNTTKQNISLHINNCFREGELEPDAVVKDSLTTALDGKMYNVRYYNLDVIISVGYRVKSNRGLEFRRWANTVLKEHILKGYSINTNRMKQLGKVIKILKRAENSLDAKQVLSVIGAIYQTFDGKDAYRSTEEKAAN
jgi:hypothetical protein